MANNIVIYGLTPDNKEEDCKSKVSEFVKEKLQMTSIDGILVAHRLGKQVGTKPRPMIVRCSQNLRDNIFKYTKNLSGKKNNLGDYYTVKTQLPEPLHTERHEREERIKEVKLKVARIPSCVVYFA